MEILKSLESFKFYLGMEAENTEITAKKTTQKTATYGIGAYGNEDWQYEIAITYGNAENFLSVKTFGNGEAAVIGRGIFEEVKKISMMIALKESQYAHFIVIPRRKNGRPVVPDNGIAFSINPETDNQHGVRFELRFTAANHVESRYATGFAVSEPGERDDGVAVFLTKRKAVILVDEIIRKAQKLRGNRKMVTAIKDILKNTTGEMVKNGQVE